MLSIIAGTITSALIVFGCWLAANRAEAKGNHTNALALLQTALAFVWITTAFFMVLIWTPW